MLLILIFLIVVYFLNLFWIRVIFKYYVVYEYEICVIGGCNVFICMKMIEFLLDYDKILVLNYWYKLINCDVF